MPQVNFGSPFATGGGQEQERDYSAQIQGGMEKVASLDPSMAAGLQAAYESREPYSENFLSGAISFIAGKGKGFAGGVIEALGNISTAFSRPFYNDEPGEEQPFYEDFWDGLTGKENTYWKDNLKSYGMEDSWTTTVLGVALDIFADPTTYIGAGGLGVARETLAVTGKELAQHGARGIITKEVAEQGGFRLGKNIITDKDFAAHMAQAGKETLTNQRVHSDAVDALSGLAAHTSERKVLASVNDLVGREVEEIGEKVADTLFRFRNLQALPTTFKTSSGRVWTRAEMQKIFKEAGRMDRHQIADLANILYKGDATDAQKALLGRHAAGAMGGLRMKFGLPFGQRLANQLDSPFLAYRWQTNAISTRFNIGNKSVGVTDIGNFFRGLSGLHKLENALQASLKNGDGVWDQEALSTFLHAKEGGFAGLKKYMYQKDIDNPGAKDAFDKLFGTRTSSVFIPWSERAGEFTAHLTPGARAWRKDGYIGWRTATLARTAKNRQKEFRQWASGEYVEKWAPTAERLAKDAKNRSPKWLKEIYTDMIRYVEGTDDAAKARLPDYIQDMVDEIGPAFAEMHTKLTGRYGVDLGDMTEVFARNKHTQAVKVVRKKMSDVQRRLDEINELPGGDKVAREALEAERGRLVDELEGLEAKADDLQAVVQGMDDWDSLIRTYAPDRVGAKASVKQYFHRRFTKEARSAIIGHFASETRVFGKAKLRTAELERKMATLSFEEASEVLRKEYGAALGNKQIFEDNPFQVMAHYIEDMGEAVLKNELGVGFQYLTRSLGAIDNGTVTKLVTDIVDPEWMPTAYRAMLDRFNNLDEAGDLVTRKEMKQWIDNFEEQLGVVGAAAPDAKTQPWHFTKKEFIRNKITDLKTQDPNTLRKTLYSTQDNLTEHKWPTESGNTSWLIEAAGDIFREVSLNGAGASSKYLKEKIGRLRSWADDLEKGRAAGEINHLKKSLGDDYFDNMDEFLGKVKQLDEQTNALPEGTMKDALLRANRVIHSVGKWVKNPDDYGEFVQNVKSLDEALAKVGTTTKGSKVTKRITEAAGKAVDETSIVSQHQREVIRALAAGEKVPLEVLRDYPEIASTLVKIPAKIQQNPEELRKLQSLMQSLNRIKTRAAGLDSFPEPAMIKIEQGIDMSKWGRLDVPGLEDYAMHPFMAAEFNRAWNGSGKQLNWLSQNWRKFVMGPWKEWATLRWPGFHLRNYMGAWFNNELGGVTTAHYRYMSKVDDILENGSKSQHYGKEMKKMMVDGEMRTIMYGGAKEGTDQLNILDMMEDLGIVGNGGLALADLRTYLNNRDFLSLDTGHGIAKRIKVGTVHTDRWGDVTGAEWLGRHWKRLGSNATATVENKMRGAMFIRALEESGDTAAARASVMMRHGDYDDLTDIEDGIKNLLPFYKWTRTNVPFQLRQLIESPGKQLATMDIGRGLVDDETRKQLPEWMRESFMIRLPWTKKDLSTLKGTEEASSFLMVQLPLEDLFTSSNEFFSSFLPVVKPLILENSVFKKSTFTGAPLEGTNYEATFLGKVPGLSHTLEALGIGKRHAESGELMIDDRWVNVMSALPIFSRARPFLTADPDRSRQRMNGFLSTFVGVTGRSINYEDINKAEADWLFNNVAPQIKRMQEQGYIFPDTQSWSFAASSLTPSRSGGPTV